MNTINNNTTNTTNTADTYENNQIMKTGNASFDAGVEFGVELGVKIGYKQGVKDSFDTNQDNQFTQEELQFLKSTFSVIIMQFHFYQKEVNAKVKELFEYCNPDDVETSETFTILNKFRDIQREKKVLIKKLAGIQKKIKNSLRN